MSIVVLSEFLQELVPILPVTSGYQTQVSIQ